MAGTTSIAKLSVALVADVSGFSRGMGKAMGKTKKFGAGMKRMGAVAARAGALMGTVVVGALAALTAAQFRAVDALAKTSDRFGIQIERLVALRRVTELAGASNKALEVGLKTMARQVVDAAAGTGMGVEALQRLGLEAKSLATLTLDAQFERIAVAMQGITNPAERIQIAYNLLGRSGVVVELLQCEQAGDRRQVGDVRPHRAGRIR